MKVQVRRGDGGVSLQSITDNFLHYIHELKKKNYRVCLLQCSKWHNKFARLQTVQLLTNMARNLLCGGESRYSGIYFSNRSCDTLIPEHNIVITRKHVSYPSRIWASDERRQQLHNIRRTRFESCSNHFNSAPSLISAI